MNATRRRAGHNVTTRLQIAFCATGRRKGIAPFQARCCTSAVLRVLFLDDHCAVRAPIAAAKLRRRGRGRFEVLEAGLKAKAARTAAVHPEAIRLLRLERSPVEELVVRDLSEVVQKWHAVDFVFVLTAPPEGFTPGVACALCCHWRIDLADLSGSLETARASLFRVASDIERRVELFSSLPIESLEREVLYDRISSIGEQPVGNGERR